MELITGILTMSLQSVVHPVVLRVVVVRSLERAPSSPSSVLLLLQLVVGEVVRKRVRVAEAAVAGNAVELLHQAHLIGFGYVCIRGSMVCEICYYVASDLFTFPACKMRGKSIFS